MINIKLDTKQLQNIVRDFKITEKQIKRAEINAVNTTATATRSLSFAEASKIYNIKAGRLKKDSRNRNSTFITRASQIKRFATIWFRGGNSNKKGDRPGLHHYRVDNRQSNKKQQGSNPRYRILRKGKVQTVRRGFYGVHGRIKGTGIYQREKGTKKIIRRTGPNIRQIILTPIVQKNVISKSEKILFDKMNDKIIDQVKKFNNKK